MLHTRWILASTLGCLVTFACSADDSPTKGGGSHGGAEPQGGSTSSASGGSTSQRTGTGPAIVIPSGTGGGSGGEQSCGVQSYLRETKPAEIILVLDRSGSMEDPPSGSSVMKWDMVLPPLKGVITSTNSTISWGLKLFPELDETASCAAESIVPTIHVPIAPDNATKVIAAIDATTPKGDGTPTGDAIQYATAHLDERSASNDSQKFILLATDGDPNCPKDDDALDYAVNAIKAAATKGYPTFVIGVDTTKDSSVERLNTMAQAGGEPRQVTDPETEPLFYLASTQSELETALSAITKVVASCVFDLVPPPPVPENIAVDFNGARAVRDPSKANGWEYTKADFTQLEVYGAWCERIKSEAQNQVQIRYGCPNEEIPLMQ